MDNSMIEELSLNHWPSLSTLFYDGWVLRLAEGYTKRANSISPLYASTLDIDHKIEACEQIYAANQLSAVYKITPFVKPAHLDQMLEDKGHSLLDPTIVQTLNLEKLKKPQIASVTITEDVNEAWIAHYCRLNLIDDRYKSIMKRMLSNIRTKKAFISLYENDRVIACGLGVIERNVIGLYDIVTDCKARNQGFGEQMILNLLQWGKENGAAHSYLAVVSNNAPALRLYAKLGYSEMYRYWYRVKPLAPASASLTT